MTYLAAQSTQLKPYKSVSLSIYLHGNFLVSLKRFFLIIYFEAKFVSFEYAEEKIG